MKTDTVFQTRQNKNIKHESLRYMKCYYLNENVKFLLHVVRFFSCGRNPRKFGLWCNCKLLLVIHFLHLKLYTPASQCLDE